MILVIDTCKHSLHSLEFVKPVTDIIRSENKDYKVVHFTKIKKEYEKADMVIICSTALKDNDALKKISRFRWIKDFDRPLLGISIGMQIIARVFGAEIKACKEIGLVKVKVLKQFPIIEEDDFFAYALHNFCAGLPEGFVKAAKSPKCLQVFVHESRPIYGMIFHPEARNKDIISKFISL